MGRATLGRTTTSNRIFRTSLKAIAKTSDGSENILGNTTYPEAYKHDVLSQMTMLICDKMFRSKPVSNLSVISFVSVGVLNCKAVTR